MRRHGPRRAPPAQAGSQARAPAAGGKDRPAPMAPVESLAGIPVHAAAAGTVQRKPAKDKATTPGKAPPIQRPPQVTWSLLAPDLPEWRTVSDNDIYAPIAENERQALEAQKREKMDALRARMEGWTREDQEFALGLLARELEQNVNVAADAVSDADRQLILDRYEQWLRAVDAQRLQDCAEHPPGIAARSRAAFSGDKPCVSWFSDEGTPGWTYAASKIQEMGRQLTIYRGLSDAVEQVYTDMFLYRKETDPKMLQEHADAASMVDGIASLGHSPAGGMEHGPAGEGRTTPRPGPEKSVWVQLENGANKEFHPSEVKGSREVKARVKTPEGPGVVVSRGEPPEAGAVTHPPDPNYVEPKLRATPPKERRITNPKHHPGSISPEPANVDQLYRNSVEDLNGVRWTKDRSGTIHRFSEPSNGERHWNGSTAGHDPITPNEIPVEIKRHFGLLK